mmetsp:Transcript_37891/g.46147  ORF Transcript_37891/g.46147 Transcript_37891/m.46147 type:complete len:159 (+) Transcript_37891:312-788(+)
MLLLLKITDKPFEEKPLGVQMFQLWVFFEVFIVTGITCANMVFLLVRSCFRNTMTVEIPDYWEVRQLGSLEKTNATKDYMSSSFVILGVFQCFFAPLFCTVIFLMLNSIREGQEVMLVSLLISQFVQSTLCGLAIFGSCVASKVPWRKAFGQRITKYA